jgi:amino acid transporter
VVKRWLVGAPIHSALESHERLPKRKAIAVFSSDALSSVAYTPQETLVILLSAGLAAAWWSLPIAVSVVLSSGDCGHELPTDDLRLSSGGGSYIVAPRIWGNGGLIAAAALIVGYILTVSVSIASAIDQLVSAVPDLLPLRVVLGVAAVVLVTVVNLRGISESGNIFAAPTYIFLLAMFALIGFGLFRQFTGQLVVPPPPGAEIGHEPFTVFLLLRLAVASAGHSPVLKRSRTASPP